MSSRVLGKISMCRNPSLQIVQYVAQECHKKGNAQYNEYRDCNNPSNIESKDSNPV